MPTADWIIGVLVVQEDGMSRPYAHDQQRKDDAKVAKALDRTIKSLDKAIDLDGLDVLDRKHLLDIRDVINRMEIRYDTGRI
jgi:hypothetical protein